jgi:uncharacterized membrane protein YphA (DoxX/SURF4 family)
MPYAATQLECHFTIVRWCLQLFIGGIIFASALGKSLDLPGFVAVLNTYRAFPDSTLWPLALGVTGVEFFLGVWFLSGWRLQTSALVGAGLNIVYAVWMTISLLRGLELTNCGCFGVFFPQPLTWISPVEDLVMVSLCLAVRRLSKTKNGRFLGERTI